MNMNLFLVCVFLSLTNFAVAGPLKQFPITSEDFYECDIAGWFEPGNGVGSVGTEKNTDNPKSIRWFEGKPRHSCDCAGYTGDLKWPLESGIMLVFGTTVQGEKPRRCIAGDTRILRGDKIWTVAGLPHGSVEPEEVVRVACEKSLERLREKGFCGVQASD